jgi:hypothetical protein
LRGDFVRLIDVLITQLKAQAPHSGPASRVMKKKKILRGSGPQDGRGLVLGVRVVYGVWSMVHGPWFRVEG